MQHIPHVGVLHLYYPGTTADGNARRYTYGSWWPQPTYHPDVDPQYYGYSLGIHRHCIMGGAYYQDKNYCGSRAARDDLYSTYVDQALAARGCIQRVLSWGKNGL